MRKLKALLVGTLFVGCALGAARATEWPKSDIPADPAVTFGVLGNGMRYAIMHNATPQGSVSVRLRIGAGSMQEGPSQRGLAHFLEHMAFRGSKNVADGEIDKSLERLGLRFGADTNAETEQDQTVYQFDLPKSDDATVGTVLGYTREIASNLTLSPDAAKTESGVVRQELALRDSPAYRAEQAELDFALKDPKATQLPSGDPAIIAKADVAELRKFYQAYYRPERATLIIIGDVDPAHVAALVKADFGDWKGVGEAGRDPKLNIPVNHSLDAKLVVEAGTRSRLSLLWTAAPRPKPDNAAREKAGLIDSLGMQILNRRLQETSAEVNPPFTGAAASSDQMFQAVKLTSFSIGFEPGQWEKALDAAEKIRLGVLASGVTQAEVDRAISEYHSSFQTAEAGAATRPSRRIMASLLSNISDNDVFTSPERDLAASDADLKGLTAADVTAALRRLFGSGAPLVFVTSPRAIDGGEGAVKAALVAVDKTPAAELPGAKEQVAAGAWPYTDFGKPGTVVETSEMAGDLGAKSVLFANGVKLTVRPSKLHANQVLVAVKVGGGRLDLPRDKSTVAWAAGALLDGGLKDISHAEMQRVLAAKTVRTGFGLGEDGFLFTGTTTPTDMNLQLQVIAAYLAAPGFRPEGMEQIKSRFAAQLRQSDTSPGAILRLKAPELLHDGDKRWATPSLEDVQGAHIEDLKALLLPVFQNGALDVTIVGDITTDKAIDLVAATLGALPTRSGAHAIVTKDNDTHLPAEKVTPIDLSHSQQTDQIITGVVWPTHGEARDLNDDATLELMSDIMQERLFDKLRGDGVAYTARVGASGSRVFDYGYLQAQAQLAPDKTGQFYTALDEITADLKDGKIAADELDRARNPALQEFEKTKQTNEYWLSVLAAAQDNPKALESPRKYDAALRQVSLADIQAAAKKYLAEPRMIRLTAGS